MSAKSSSLIGVDRLIAGLRASAGCELPEISSAYSAHVFLACRSLPRPPQGIWRSFPLVSFSLSGELKPPWILMSLYQGIAGCSGGIEYFLNHLLFFDCLSTKFSTLDNAHFYTSKTSLTHVKHVKRVKDMSQTCLTLVEYMCGTNKSIICLKHV